MIVLILCVLLILLLSLLLFTPFQLWIDSTRSRYQLRWGRWMRAGLLPVSDDLLLQLWILGWRKSYSVLSLLRQRMDSSAKRKKPARKKPAKARSRSVSWQRIRKLLRTFKVKHWRVDVDTDDVVWNAYLFPVTYFLRRASYPVSLNYEGRVEIELLLENRPVWIIRALVF